MANARIIQQAPVLLASNLTRSVAYWADCVGFAAHGVWGEPPDFAILMRDTAHLMLSQAPAKHTITPHWRIKDKLWNAYFWVDDARSMFDELKQRGATIDYALNEQPYGVLEFGIQDLDEHDIGIGENLNPDRPGGKSQ